MLITVVAATPSEIQPLSDWLEANFAVKGPALFEKDRLHVRILTTGVGIALTSLNLGFYFSKEKPDLAINAGIAGAFAGKLVIGDVVNVTSEIFGDLGAETADGNFMDVHELNLIKSNEAPFEDGVIHNPGTKGFNFLPKHKGLTVNKVHGNTKSIDFILSKYDCDIESMEGAAFFLACRLAEVDFLEIRSISNFIEPRNKENWNIPFAINQLNQVLIELLKTFLDQPKN